VHKLSQEKIIMRTGKITNLTVSKGYRLKPSTHNMIKKIQMHLNGTQDKVIRAAMKMYSVHIKK
jgi:retron-type reverse transcriptase